MKKVMLILSILLLTACQNRKAQEEVESEKPKTVVSKPVERPPEPSRVKATEQVDEEIIEQFFDLYINQEVSVSDVEERMEKLSLLLTDEAKANTNILDYLKRFKIQIEDWETQGKPAVQYGFTLTKRKLTKLEIYQKEEQFLVVVTYKESISDEDVENEILKFYTLKILDGKVSYLKTVGEK